VAIIVFLLTILFAFRRLALSECACPL